MFEFLPSAFNIFSKNIYFWSGLPEASTGLLSALYVKWPEDTHRAAWVLMIWAMHPHPTGHLGASTMSEYMVVNSKRK